jgi:hypothetical protein
MTLISLSEVIIDGGIIFHSSGFTTADIGVLNKVLCVGSPEWP